MGARCRRTIQPKVLCRAHVCFGSHGLFFQIGGDNRLKGSKKGERGWFYPNRHHFRYGVPRYIVTDNSKPFVNKLMSSLCEKFQFSQHKLSMYNAPANGPADAFNKTLCNLLKKVVSKSKRDWHEKLEEVLWAYRASYRRPIESTSYALVYRVKAILPLEIQILSLRIAMQEGFH